MCIRDRTEPSQLVTQPLDSSIVLAAPKIRDRLPGHFGYGFNSHGQEQDSQMKHGARNDIVGEVAEIKSGDLMAKATVKINGEFNLSSVMTTDSLAALGIEKGDKVRVLVKAVNVLLVKDA